MSENSGNENSTDSNHSVIKKSMGNYFARDDSLDPALSTICQTLGGSLDIKCILIKRGETFLSLASIYYHLKSPADRDLMVTTHSPRYRGSGGRSFKGDHRKPPTTKPCWEFQKHDRCLKRDCKFKHRCIRCNSKNHGERNCRTRRRAK